MLLALLALGGIRLELGKPRDLPPDIRVVRVFPEDLLRVEEGRVVPLRGGAGVVLVETPRGVRPVPVQVRPFRERLLRRIPPRVGVPPGEEVRVIPPGDYEIRALAFPEKRVRLAQDAQGLRVTCSRPGGRSVIFYELRTEKGSQFGRTLVVCLPGREELPWWEPLYLRKGETRAVESLAGWEAWARGGVTVRQEGRRLVIEGVEPGRGALVISRRGRRRLEVPVYVDIPPLFPPQVLTLPVNRLELPPNVDSVKVFPPRALQVYLDGTVEVRHPVPVARVEVWKDGRVGVITLLGHRPRRGPVDRRRPRGAENLFRTPPGFPSR